MLDSSLQLRVRRLAREVATKVLPRMPKPRHLPLALDPTPLPPKAKLKTPERIMSSTFTALGYDDSPENAILQSISMALETDKYKVLKPIIG